MARPGRRRSEASHQQILDATLSGLIEHGFTALTIEGIAAQAGVSKATIYRWWPSKAWLVMEVLLQLSRGWLPMLPPEGGVREALLAQIQRWVDHSSSPAGAALNAVVQAAGQDAELNRAYMEGYLEPRRREMREFFIAAQHKGELDPAADPEEMMDALYGPMYFRQVVRRQPSTHEFCERIVEYFLRCYTPAGSLAER